MSTAFNKQLESNPARIFYIVRKHGVRPDKKNLRNTNVQVLSAYPTEALEIEDKYVLEEVNDKGIPIFRLKEIVKETYHGTETGI